MDYVLSLAIIQGILLTLVILYKRFSDKRTVRLLLLLLALTIVIMFGRASYQPEFLLKYWAFVSLPDALLFVFGPIAYLLTRSLMKVKRLGGKDLLLHFTPALFHALVLNVILGLIIIRKMPYLNYEHLVIIYQFIEGTGIISIGAYLIVSYQLYQNNKSYYSSNFSSIEAPSFLIRFFILELILVALWSISFIAKLIGVYEFMDYRIYHFFWIAVSFSIYLLTFYFLIQPELLNLPQLKVVEKLSIDTDPKLFSYSKEELHQLMLKEKYYLDATLNLDGLADHLSINRNDLSAMINSLFERNFFDFVNTYRIEEFLKLYPQRYNSDNATTFIEVAYEVGFNSKSSFNRAFKKYLNTTPTHYFKMAPDLVKK